jgi:hypothetical protein
MDKMPLISIAWGSFLATFSDFVAEKCIKSDDRLQITAERIGDVRKWGVGAAERTFLGLYRGLRYTF